MRTHGPSHGSAYSGLRDICVESQADELCKTAAKTNKIESNTTENMNRGQPGGSLPTPTSRRSKHIAHRGERTRQAHLRCPEDFSRQTSRSATPWRSRPPTDSLMASDSCRRPDNPRHARPIADSRGRARWSTRAHGYGVRSGYIKSSNPELKKRTRQAKRRKPKRRCGRTFVSLAAEQLQLHRLGACARHVPA